MGITFGFTRWGATHRIHVEGGGSGIINSITRRGTFNYAVLYWSNGRIYCKERQGVFLLFLVLFCFALFLPRNEHVMITKFYF